MLNVCACGGEGVRGGEGGGGELQGEEGYVLQTQVPEGWAGVKGYFLFSWSALQALGVC